MTACMFTAHALGADR